MLYNLSEKFGCNVMLGDDTLALMATDEDVKYLIRMGLPYAIEHNYGVFMDKDGNRLTERDVTEEIVNQGFYVKGRKEPNRLETVWEDMLGYALYHPQLLLVPDDAHMPAETKPHVIYTMLDVKGFTARKAADVLNMSF